jgi:hypothetical protein
MRTGALFACFDEVAAIMNVAIADAPRVGWFVVSDRKPRHVHVVMRMRTDTYSDTELEWRETDRGDWYDVGGMYSALQGFLVRSGVVRGEREFYAWIEHE